MLSMGTLEVVFIINYYYIVVFLIEKYHRIVYYHFLLKTKNVYL